MGLSISVRVPVLQSLTFVVLTGVSLTSRADVAVVLVTDKDSPIQRISSLDIRKAYLGIPVSVDGNTVRALRRSDDERLNQIFLQSVVAMSERSYERRLLSLMLKFGTPRPDVVDDGGELLELLDRYPSSISYMWKRDAEKDPRVRIIGGVWQET